MTYKQQYIRHCETNATQLFMQPWWLDAVCNEGKDWDVLGCLPYLKRKKYGFNIGLQPQFTQRFEMNDINSFEEAIDKQKIAYFYNQFSCDEHEIEKLKKANFNIQKRVTYRINDITDIEHIKGTFSENKRRQLKCAERENLTLDFNLTADEFYHFHKQCLQKREQRINYSNTLFQAIYKATKEHKQGQIIATRNNQNIITAAIFLVWDEKICYYLIPTYDIDYTKTGSMAWLTLEAIRFAQSKSKIFDFEGSMIPSIANSYQQFGGKPYKYYSIEKRNSKIFGLLFDIYKWIKK